MATLVERLPDDVSERVLSFLPVHALSRCRSVCRKWNELVRKQSFLDLCDRNGGNRQYLFLMRYLNARDYSDNGWSAVDDAYRRTMCFFDLEERRWYSIQANEGRLLHIDMDSDDWMIPRLVSMDDGLVCEVFVSEEPFTDIEYRLAMFDPLASFKFDQELPASTPEGKPLLPHIDDIDPEIDAIPAIVTVVDDADRSFKVFLMYRDFGTTGLSGFFVYGSSTSAWRGLETPSDILGDRVGRMLEESAVFFQGNLYAVFWNDDVGNEGADVLLSFNLEENLWREVFVVEVKRPGFPQLFVSGSRMYMALWSNVFQLDSMFEIREILVDKSASRSLVKIPGADLNRISGETFGIQYGFPLNSNSVVLISRQTGSLLTYDLRSGVVGALPAHPLRHLSEKPTLKPEESDMGPPHYRAKLTNLSLRNILDQGACFWRK